MRPIAPVERVLRYGVAGLSVSCLYTVLVVRLEHGLPSNGPTGNTALAFLVVQPISFILHGAISYPETRRSRNCFPNIGLRFAVTNSVGFATSIGCMVLVTGPLSASYLWGLAISWALIPVFNFAIYFIWVFQPVRQSQERM